MSGGRDILEDVTKQDGCLLRVEILPARRPGSCRGVLLTFDVGVFIFEPADDGRELRVAPLEGAHPLADESVSADEEEPWWALLGQPLVRARQRLAAGGTREGVELQFRADDENPRRVSLSLDEDSVRVSARPGAL